LENVRSWPQEDQEELVECAREIAAVREGVEQARRGEFVLDDEIDVFWKQISEALSRSAEDVRRGRSATDDEVKAIFDRYRPG